ncbi:MAG: hypothetical protein IPK15_24175 [Verrucomicrobia bacterium]|nr:hypothetical protein [Verrucomicrobiota bacterium]
MDAPSAAAGADGGSAAPLAGTARRAARLAEFYTQREKLIRLSEENPFAYGTEPAHWKDADRLLAMMILILIIFGGNRAGKSEYAAKRVVQDAMAHPDSVIFCLHENEKASIGLQQKYIWKYLPPEIQALNGKKHPVFKVNYSQANGFTDGKIVLPNRTEIYFLTYHQKPSDFEGLELGAKHTGGRLAVWADENLPLPWLNMLKLRCVSRGGKILWTYTPVNGITPTIKELLGGTPKTEESRFAELLPDRVNVPGLPVGHMPYIVQPTFEKSRAIYFFSILNPFGAHSENIRALCVGKPSEYIERRAYGYSRDVAQRRFPYFGPWNVIRPDHLPAVGTNYMFTDPAGGRNWATIWVRVAPGNPPKYYIYRDWPNEQRYGEWAVPTEREVTESARRGWDGDPGPAQNSLGYGIVQYKQLFLREETFSANVAQRDPYRQSLIVNREMAEDGTAIDREATTMTLSESVQERYIDSRAGRNQMAADKGGTCLIDELAKEQRHPASGEVIGPAMRFRLASGVDIEEGVTSINDLLFWNKDEPLIPLLNEPRLYVSEDCKQVIWALANYTGLGGETGACKDFVDLVRYMALARLRYLAPGAMVVTGGGTY